DVRPWLEAFETGHILEPPVERALLRDPALEAFSDVTLSWERPEVGEVIRFLERRPLAALRLRMEKPGAELLRGVAGLTGYRPQVLEVSPDRAALEGWEALARSPVLSELRHLEARFPNRSGGLATLAGSTCLDALRELWLCGDQMTGKS